MSARFKKRVIKLQNYYLHLCDMQRSCNIIRLNYSHRVKGAAHMKTLKNIGRLVLIGILLASLLLLSGCALTDSSVIRSSALQHTDVTSSHTEYISDRMPPLAAPRVALNSSVEVVTLTCVYEADALS